MADTTKKEKTMPLQKMDPDIKMEIIINMAWGISIKDISEKYNISEKKIVNLRKNNYKLYNQIAEEFYIPDNIAVLGLSPVFERAVHIVKKQYPNRFKILTKYLFRFDNENITMTEVIKIADQIVIKDNIPKLSESKHIKNHYMDIKNNKRGNKCKPKQKK